MKITLKELRKTLTGLRIIERKTLCSPERLTDIGRERDELMAIFVKRVRTAEQNSKK